PTAALISMGNQVRLKMSNSENIIIKPMERGDLDSVNAIVEACVAGWDLPERVKRLSLGSYRYSEHDLDHLTAVVAVIKNDEIIGVATWESADSSELPQNQQGMLLHGLYVAPGYQGHGVGRRLINSALEAARRQGMDGLLVKAQSDAVGYFQSRGFTYLPIENAQRDYPHRWWLAI
ncbi:MAG: GNAT family N-acetyltransferase, partial [Candidatus Thiodiazotropha sp.]